MQRADVKEGQLDSMMVDLMAGEMDSQWDWH